MLCFCLHCQKLIFYVFTSLRRTRFGSVSIDLYCMQLKKLGRNYRNKYMKELENAKSGAAASSAEVEDGGATPSQSASGIDRFIHIFYY